jgi:hypothetical protein
VIFGLIWQRFGSTSAFTVSAAVTAAAALLMIALAGSRGSGARHVP